MFQKKEKRLKYIKNLWANLIERSPVNDMILLEIDYLNMFFLYDLYIYYRAVTVLENHKKEVQNIYEAIAMLDVAQLNVYACFSIIMCSQFCALSKSLTMLDD